MIDVYVLDKTLTTIGVVDAYKSLIWANRYRDNGDCELYLPASDENLLLLGMGYYLIRTDDDMVCRIRKIEIDTDAEQGNYLIVTGIDAKSYLDQRIIWKTSNCTGNVETFIRKLVKNALVSPSDNDRKISIIQLGTAAGFEEVAEEQVSYANLGEKIREYCATYGWGYRMTLNNSNKLEFELYAGDDLSSLVVFSDQYENLSSTTYIDSCEDMTNSALIGGVGEGNKRIKAELGTASGTDRYEIFVDAKDLSNQMNYEDLVDLYPGGSVVQSSSKYYYTLSSIDIPIVDDEHLAWLQTNYAGGTVVTVDDIDYYRVSSPQIAEVPSATPANNDTAVLQDLIYHSYLLNKGVAAVGDAGEKESFEGSVIDGVMFSYKVDYFLGDIVYVENEYGIGAAARITEVIESVDESGYKIEPTFEYIS